MTDSCFGFEGEEITGFTAQLPSIKLEAAEVYPRGTHLMVTAEYRVRSVHIEEDKKGNLSRHHVLALEDLTVTGRQTPEERRAAITADDAGTYDEGTDTETVEVPVAPDTAADTGHVDVGVAVQGEESSGSAEDLAVDVDSDWLDETLAESVNS